MKLFYHEERPEISEGKLEKGLRDAYGIKSGEMPNGTAGFTYRMNDIYLYGRLENIVELRPCLQDELNEFINRFFLEDYGFVTPGEHDNNVENRWLAGTSDWTVGRYSFSKESGAQGYGGVVLEYLDGVGFLYLIDEDMTAAYSKVAHRPDYHTELQYRAWQ